MTADATGPDVSANPTYPCWNCPKSVAWFPHYAQWLHTDGVEHCPGRQRVAAPGGTVPPCTSTYPDSRRLRCTGHAVHAARDVAWGAVVVWMPDGGPFRLPSLDVPPPPDAGEGTP